MHIEPIYILAIKVCCTFPHLYIWNVENLLPHHLLLQILHSSDDGPLEHNQKIENVEQVIQEVNCNGVRRFTGSSDLIVDGDQEATLELVWWVIFIIQLSFEGSSEIDLWDEAKVREEMLKWVQRRLARWVIRILYSCHYNIYYYYNHMLRIVVLSYSGLCAYSVNTCKGVACVFTCILWFCY